ncbi:hypothetical protein Q7P37_004099 [Cladosporium fusiforme]
MLTTRRRCIKYLGGVMARDGDLVLVLSSCPHILFSSDFAYSDIELPEKQLTQLERHPPNPLAAMAAVAMSSPVQDTTSTTTRATPTLLNIPAELRNKIYTQVYELPPTGTRFIESTDNHPSLDSILACRQLHSEFKQMYTNACRNYWPGKAMVIKLLLDTVTTTAANDLRRASKAGILYVESFCVVGRDFRFDLDYSGHVWYSWTTSLQPPRRATQMLPWHVNSILRRSEVEGEIGDPTRGLGLSADYVVGIMEHARERVGKSMLTATQEQLLDVVWPACLPSARLQVTLQYLFRSATLHPNIAKHRNHADAMATQARRKRRRQSDSSDNEHNKIVSKSTIVHEVFHHSISAPNIDTSHSSNILVTSETRILLPIKPSRRSHITKACACDAAIEQITRDIAGLQFPTKGLLDQSHVDKPTLPCSHELRARVNSSAFWNSRSPTKRPPKRTQDSLGSPPASHAPKKEVTISNPTQSKAVRAHLLAIPSEIRNKIYELVYDAQMWKQAALSQPEKIIMFVYASDERQMLRKTWTNNDFPSQNAILACRQLYAEMNRMFQHARSAYWNTKTFVITFDMLVRGSRSSPSLQRGNSLATTRRFGDVVQLRRVLNFANRGLSDDFSHRNGHFAHRVKTFDQLEAESSFPSLLKQDPGKLCEALELATWWLKCRGTKVLFPEELYGASVLGRWTELQWEARQIFQELLNMEAMPPPPSVLLVFVGPKRRRPSIYPTQQQKRTSSPSPSTPCRVVISATMAQQRPKKRIKVVHNDDLQECGYAALDTSPVNESGPDSQNDLAPDPTQFVFTVPFRIEYRALYIARNEISQIISGMSRLQITANPLTARPPVFTRTPGRFKKRLVQPEGGGRPFYHVYREHLPLLPCPRYESQVTEYQIRRAKIATLSFWHAEHRSHQLKINRTPRQPRQPSLPHSAVK